MNVAFGGLTAAGKTTHARLLAEDLGFDIVEATPILLGLEGIDDPDPDTVWFRHHDASEVLREGDGIDDRLEEQLLRLMEERKACVFDTWAMPWLYGGAAVRLFIQSQPRERAWKAYISQPSMSVMDVGECGYHIAIKDETTRQRFLRRHNFDLYRDHDVFDAILDNSALLAAPTRAAADEGIESFRPYVFAVATLILKGDDAAIERLRGERGDEFARTVVFCRGLNHSQTPPRYE